MDTCVCVCACACVYMLVCNWTALLYSRNQCNTANELHVNKNTGKKHHIYVKK